MSPHPTAPDVLIVGAGVIGCSIATELARRGHRTLNLDRGRSAGSGSTASSSAVVRFSYSTANGVHLSWEGLQYWLNWADHIGVGDELGLVEYQRCGQLMLMRTPDDYSHQVRDLWQELDIPFESFTEAALRERFSFLDTGIYGPPTLPDDDEFWKSSTGTMLGAIYSPDAGYISDPQLAAHNLQMAAEAAGGEFRFGSEVVAINQADGAVTGVTLADGTVVDCPIVVNVAGPHSAVINEMAGVRDSMAIKTAPMRQEVHHVPAPPDVDINAHGMVMADDDVGFYCRPELGNNLLIGSIEPECDVLEWIDDADDFHPGISELWETQVLRANRRFPDLGMPHQRRGLAGVYDVSDDWMPIYDRTDLDGFFVAIGSSGNQFKNAGAAGHIMAELIEAVAAGHDHDGEPLQVTGAFTGRPIDVGAFSRNRVVNADSSMSVQG